VTLDENRFDFAGAAGPDFGGLLDPSGRLELIALVGGRYLYARNSGFPFHVLGPSGGLRAAWTVAPFTVRAIAGYTTTSTSRRVATPRSSVQLLRSSRAPGSRSD